MRTKERNPLCLSGFLWYREKQSVAKNYKNKAGHTGVEINSRISEISTHCGRKTFICFMLSIGIAPQVVMKFTGHADYKSMKPYIDIAEKAKTDAMDAMEAALNK